MDCEQRCRDEVRELHDFFAAWFRGDLPDTDAAFERFAGVMAPSFQIVTPGGVALDRDPILDAVRKRRGSSADFDIEIRNHVHRFTIGDITVVTYEEVQRDDGVERVRFSSAVLQSKPGAPQGVEWLHLHETWIGS